MNPPARLFSVVTLAILPFVTALGQPFTNRAIIFNGSSTRIHTNSAWNNGWTGFNPAYITVEAWIKPERVAGTNFIAEDALSSNNSVGWQLYILDGKLHFRASDDVCCAQNCVSNASILLNTWTHVAGTYSPDDSLRIYINGQLEQTVKAFFTHIGTLGANNQILSIGDNNDDNVAVYSYFQGQMDEIRMWSVSRSGAAIAANYQKWLTGNESGLYLYYHCDEAAGDTIYNYGLAGAAFNLWVPYPGTLAHSAVFALPGFPSVPVDTSLAPWTGNVGTSVRLYGANFSTTPSANIVRFGGVRSATPTGVLTTQMDVLVPPGAGYAPVQVTVGGLTASTPRQFTPTFNGIDAISGGSFEANGNAPTLAQPQRLIVADLDDDGMSDVVVNSPSFLSFHRNISTAKNLQLANPTTLPAEQPSNSVPADFDGDGKLDIAAGWSDGWVDVWRNTSTTGSISFSRAMAGVGGNATSLAVADFDGDGRPDLLAGVVPWYTLRILRNLSTVGSISFSEMIQPSGVTGNYVSAGDVDGDQKPDILFLNQGAGTLTVLHNGGTLGGIRFDSAWTISLAPSSQPTASIVTDLNADGKPDIAVFCPGTDEVVILRNNGAASPVNYVRTNHPYQGLGSPTDMAVGDADGDGLPDVVISSNLGPVVAYRNASTAGGIVFETGIDVETGNAQIGLALADLNNDGRPDLLTLNQPNSALSLLRNTPLGTPGNFSATDDQATGVTLTWDDRAEGETGYVIYRDGVQVQSVGANAAIWEDNSPSLLQGKPYAYWVAATNDAKGLRSDTVYDFGRKQFRGEITGKVTTQGGVGGGAGISGVNVSLARSTPNRYKALSFDGVNDYVTIPFTGDFELSTGTIECWVRPEWGSPPSTAPVIIANGDAPSRYSIRMSPALDALLISGMYFGSPSEIPVPYAFASGNWYHIALIMNGPSMSVMINGTVTGGFPLTAYPRYGAPLVIGGYTGSARFQGEIDEVRVWNYVRSVEAIQASMNSYIPSGTSGLIGYWRFDEGAGLAAGDNGASGNRYASLLNGVAWTDVSSPARRAGTTDAQGNYAISQIDYGDATTTAYLSARRGTDVITPDTITVQFTQNSYVFGEQSFIDTSTFAVTGKISIKGYPGVGLKGVSLLVDGFPIDSTGEGGLFSIGVTADPHVVKPVWHGHTFSPESLVVQIQNDTAGVVFEDLTRDTLRGIVAAGLCEYPMGVATVRLIETSSGSASYDTSITTGPSGQFSVRVPALSYKVFVEDLASHDADAIAWFAAQQRNMSIVEQDPEALADTTLFPPGVDWKFAELLYRSKPILTIQGMPTAGECPSVIVRQGKRIPVRVKVTEQYGNYPPCVVDTGKIDIADDVGDREVPVAVPLTNGLATYNLIAGQPNVVGGGDHPYGKLFQVQTTQPGGASTADFWMVVIGTRSRGRTSTTVTPQLPFLVLRDPPGDHSSSYMHQDSTYCFDWGFSERQELSLGGWVSGRAGLMTDVPLITDAGFYVDITVSAGYEGARDTSSHFTSCVRASEVIQTSDEEDLVGPPGDIYVTVSLVLSYGVSDILSFDPQTCQPSLSRRLTFDRVTFNNLIAYTDTYIRRTEIPRLDGLIAYWQQLGNADSAGLFQRTKDQWLSILDNAAEERAQSIASPFAGQDTIAYSGGVTLSREWESTQERSSHFETSVVVDEHAAISGGIIQSNDIAHLLAGFEQGFRWERFWDTTKTTTVSKAFGYTLNDDDPLDGFHVNLRQSANGGSPIFVLLDGATSCPWEPGTQRRQLPQLSLYPPVSNGVDPESTVIITAQCSNLSESGDTVSYRLDNPYAAGDSVPYLYIGDTPFIGLSAPIKVPPGEFRNLYVSVKKAPQWSDYNNVRLVLFSDCDPIHTGDTASFAIHFEDGVDGPPEVLSKSAVVAKGDTAVIELKAVDPDGGQVTFQLIEEPRHGRFLDDAPPTLTYLPDAGYTGADRFLVNASDGVNVVPQRFDLSVVNTPPIAARARIDTTVDEDTPITFHLAGIDPDGDALEDSIVYRPAHGTLSGTLADLIYVPEPDYNGTDDFTYGFLDGQSIGRATVGIILRAVADPLTVRHDTCALAGSERNITVNVLSNDRTKDDQPLAIVDSVVWGSSGFALNDGNGSLTYYDTSGGAVGLPSASAKGLAPASAKGLTPASTDHLTYHVTNGVDTVEEELTIDINRVNGRPVAGFGSALDFDGVNDGVTTDFRIFHPSEITIEYWFKGENPHSVVREQPDDLTYVVSGWLGLHILSNDGGIGDGLPTGNISDGQWHHSAMTWKQNTAMGFRSYRDGVLVAARNSADTPLPTGPLSGGPLTIGYAYLYGEYMKGTLDEVRIWNVARSDSEIAAGMYTTYPPETPGLDASWHFDESSGDTTFQAGNNPFLPASPLSNMTNPWQAAGVLPKVVVPEDDSTEITLPAYDRDDDPLTYSIIGQPSHGTMSWNGVSWAYVPEKDFTGFDYVTYSVNDGKASSALPATRGIEVQNAQDPPVTATNSFETPKNREVFLRLVASDPDPDDVLQYIVGTPLHGALTRRDTFPNEFFYHPAAGFAGADSFVYGVTDGTDTTSAVVPIFVTNTRPVAPDTLVAQPAGTVFHLVLPASDGDGDSLDYTILTPTSHGTLGVDSLPKIVFTQDPGYYSPDSLAFIVSDGAEADTGTVTFVVLVPTAVEDPKPSVPLVYELYQNYPNPFNPVTTIEYDLAHPSRVTLTVFNILGQEVTTLIDELQPAGKQMAPFNANRYASGVYFYRLVARSTDSKDEGTKNTFIKVRKMLLLK